MKVTKYQLMDKSIWVIDGALNQSHLTRLTLAMKGAAFRRNEFATPDSQSITHHALELSAEQLAQLGLAELSKKLLAKFKPNRNFSVHRQYCNACYYGDLLLSTPPLTRQD